MKTLITPTYTFNAATRELNLSGIAGFDIKKLYSVINVTRSTIIYAIGLPGLGYSALTGSTLTLVFDTNAAGHANGDVLAVMYDDRLLEIPSDDTDVNPIPVRALPQHVSRIGFAKAITNNIDTEWGDIIGSIGAGMTVNQTGGNLVIGAGVTARSETIIRSKASWKGGVRLRVRSTLSQRIVNNNFFAELVDVIGDGLSYTITSATAIEVTIPNNPFNAENVGQSMFIGVFSGTGTFLSGRYTIASVAGNLVTFTVAGFAAGSGTCSLFGWNYYQLLYTGATATQASFQTQRRGYANAAVTPTINTTAAPGHLAVITGNDLMATFADQLTASATTIQQTFRANQVENVPDDANLRLQIRTQNGSTAPASNTTWTIGFVSVSNFALQDVSMQDVRPMGISSAIPIEILRSVALGITGTVTVDTELPAAAALADGAANPTSPLAGATMLGFNNTTWDRWRNNQALSAEASSAKTASGNSASAITNHNASGAIFFINVTAVSGTTPTLAVRLQVQDPVGSGWIDIPGAVTPSISANGLSILTVYPGIVEAANSRVNFPLPRTYRLAWTIGGTTPSFTFSVGVQYIL